MAPLGLTFNKPALKAGLILLHPVAPPASEWVLVPREGGGWIFCRPDLIPTGATLEAELGIRERMIEKHRRWELRRNWDADLAAAGQRLDDVLLQAVRTRSAEAGREPRSRRVVRSGSASRAGPDGDSDSDPHDDVARSPGGPR